LKFDLFAHVQGNTYLTSKLENYFSNNNKGTGKLTEMPNEGINSSQRATTPPMQGLAKANMKIKMGQGEIEQKTGQALQKVTFQGMEQNP
jgi:hypothetical protein